MMRTITSKIKITIQEWPMPNMTPIMAETAEGG
jgi:hypothetical protein